MTKVFYRIVMGRKLNLNKPETFNEKIQWLKLNYYPYNSTVIQCADKYRVREYVKSKGLDDTLIGLYGVWDNVQDIPWDDLPDKFALKCNHGCAYNIICDDKNSLDKKKAIKQLNRWMKEDFSLFNCEVHYSRIDRKIICEKYIETDGGFFPVDYKFFCFNGKPAFIGVFIERSTELKRVFMDLDWKPLRITKDCISDIPKRPSCYTQMLHDVEILCKDFVFVRVDLYALNNSVVFGELTFTPTGGMAPFFLSAADRELGDLLVIPDEIKRGV